MLKCCGIPNYSVGKASENQAVWSCDGNQSNQDIEAEKANGLPRYRLSAMNTEVTVAETEGDICDTE